VPVLASFEGAATYQGQMKSMTPNDITGLERVKTEHPSESPKYGIEKDNL
jgi:hypothetical protein